ncbi:hypothetical protein HK100_007557 [Physocladia obscura]|uniref:Succinate dehydrogenase assembly factor 4, mitochondrial n=1 Tax=Physocladia obscura TaxID=109957 RepID=A0AAD5T4Q7_9FUNG|nr:hypothetical protein HK100_007557 [Physocladia obscura]
MCARQTITFGKISTRLSLQGSRPGRLIPLRLYSNNNSGSSFTAKDFTSVPGPVPLADRAQQKEFERLVKEFADAPGAHPDAPATQTKSTFEGPKNPATGEINGPTGPEPTRYGDWEKNGRVYDF